MNHKIQVSLIFVCALLLGVFIGRSIAPLPDVQWEKREPHHEISVIDIQSISGDLLQMSVFGNVRFVWGDDQFREPDPQTRSLKIPLSQIFTPEDLQFSQFLYTGNKKTMKFYPSDSYYARGTHPSDRRFFNSKQEAIDAGFVPIKNMP